jgi:phosphoglycerate kinase
MKLRTLSKTCVENKTVLLRADFNVPVYDGKVLETSRLRAVSSTVQFLMKHDAKKILIISHMGRPKVGDASLSLKFLVPYLEEIFGQEVGFGGDSSQKISLLENLRFDPREEENSPEYAKELSKLADIFVNDAFSVSHRAHASVEAITHFLPSYAGLELEKEVLYLEKVLNTPNHPSVAIIGGSKVSTKIQVLENLSKKVDTLILGGGMANTFLWAQGFNMGKSLIEKEFKDTALALMNTCHARGVNLVLPHDGAIIKEGIRHEINVSQIMPDDSLVDIGEQTSQKIDSILKNAKTILWNGPVGIFEESWGSKGTLNIAHSIEKYSSSDVISMAGGGETVAAIYQAGIENKLTHVSMAGGAFLEWLGGTELPGVKALAEK